ncbi:bifunctional UDP-sugar hydrolase/5'-nucleotidase [Amorphus sp. 3PC139-8]|uniref:bifunctional metallophosphatase/5'-nucleotidase n=1 Tax=Amorphus sp. 3PC139-8 TaxID=2735676 RepID=UPI00345DBF10
MRTALPRTLFKALGALSVWIATSLVVAPAGAEPAGKLTVLVINDADQMTTASGRGGLDRIAGAIAAERAAHDRVLVVHAGDTISPSLMSSIDQGAHIVDLLNTIGFDIFVPGNHEFDFGKEVFLERMRALDATKLAANLRGADGKLVAGFQDRVILDFDGIKLGILGVIGDRAAVVSSPGDLQFQPTLQTAFEQAKLLRNEGAELVVAVVHDNVSRDMLLARSGAFDLVLSGDDHVLTVVYDGRTVLMESREQGDLIAVVDLSLDVRQRDDGRVVNWSPSFRVIDTSTVSPSPEIAAKVASYSSRLTEALDEPIATLETDLDTRRTIVRKQEAAFGNLVADAMRTASGADVAIMNGGGIRGNTVHRAGTTLTRRDILTELPFGNQTVLLEITGTDIVRALENGFSLVETGAGRYPQISGMIVTADTTLPPGSRVVSVEIDGKPLDPGQRYRLATNDFMARGGDGYTALRNAQPIIDAKDGALLTSNVVDYIATLSPFAPATDGRIRQK